MSASLTDLCARARRGELAEPEYRQLESMLAGSIEAQLVHRAGCEFDSEDSVLPGDDSLAARVTARVIASRERPSARRSRVGWLVGSATICVAAAAAATAGPGVMNRLGWRASVSVVSSAAHEPQALSRSRGAAPVPSPQAPSAEPPGTMQSPLEIPTAPPQPRPTALMTLRPAAAGGTPNSDPAAIFAEGNRARRQGRTAQAVTLYQQLQHRFPSSVEAHSADIALGMLYAETSPKAALTHFRRYLAMGGPLVPEALWGQARALDALGKLEDARASWRDLLTRFPGSAYANVARAKLGSDQ